MEEWGRLPSFASQKPKILSLEMHMHLFLKIYDIQFVVLAGLRSKEGEHLSESVTPRHDTEMVEFKLASNLQTISCHLLAGVC